MLIFLDGMNCYLNVIYKEYLGLKLIIENDEYWKV